MASNPVILAVIIGLKVQIRFQGSESLLDMIRVAAYAHQTDKAIWLAEHCMDKGYEVTINLMAVSTVIERDLEESLTDLAKSKVPIVYFLFLS